ncbi:DUF4831 family protein [Halosquirtibacter laminarini]|uniref:DUF4831 family protein n=1 Tax=Halosquirtibacter laminarini TaxID=3374600 RepID=A0AC61NQY1_9BACT|nr:DUF4831 family protein [Prolixibacteraceae bacterium]
MKTFKILALLMFCNLLVMAAPDRKKGEEVKVPYQNGPVYALPATGIRVYVDAVYEEFIPGPYQKYAEELLQITNTKKKSFASWKIKTIRFGSFVTADAAEYHQVKSENMTHLSVNSYGIIKGINGEFEDQITPIPCSQNDFMTIEPSSFSWNDLSIQEFVQVNDSLPEQWVKLSEKQKAYDAAHTITKLRKRRFHMLSSEYETVPPDGDAYKVVVDQLKKIENRYTELFTGKHIKRTRSFVFDVVPGNSAIVAFRFDSQKGVVPTSDLSGKPMMLSVTANAQMKSSLKKQSGASSVSPEGLYYRMPCLSEIVLMDGTKVIATSKMMIAQQGVRFPLSPNFCVKENKYEITYNQNTGALNSVKQLVPLKVEED